MLRLASARTPGSKRREPSFSAASRSMVPTTRSSDALIGSSTTRMRRVVVGNAPPAARSRHIPAQMLPPSPPKSLACPLLGVDAEIPAVVGRRELVSAVLLDLGRVASLEVVADGGLDLARGRVQTQAEHARADVGVEPPGGYVDGAALAEQRDGVAVRRDGDLRRAKVGDRQGRRRSKDLSRHGAA